MYQIVNNNITITRGETAKYNVKIIDKATGAPFILPAEVELTGDDNKISKFMAVFTVRGSDYIKDMYAFRKYLWLCGVDAELPTDEDTLVCHDVILLSDDRIFTYLEADWDANYFDEVDEDGLPIVHTDPEYGEEQIKRKQCYKRKLSTGQYEYKWFNVDENKWVDYSFTIKFPFLYTNTANLPPKGYKYALTLYGGKDLKIEDDRLTGIDYKKPLVNATFTVEADINE